MNNDYYTNKNNYAWFDDTIREIEGKKVTYNIRVDLGEQIDDDYEGYIEWYIMFLNKPERKKLLYLIENNSYILNSLNIEKLKENLPYIFVSEFSNIDYDFCSPPLIGILPYDHSFINLKNPNKYHPFTNLRIKMLSVELANIGIKENFPLNKKQQKIFNKIIEENKQKI